MCKKNLDCSGGGDRLPVHLNSSYSTACPGDTLVTEKTSNVPVEEPETVERHNFPEEKEADKLELQTWPDS